MNLPKWLARRVKVDKPLSPQTTFRIGGRARYWFEPRTREELALFLSCRSSSLPVFVIGCGSNLLVADGSVDKVFVSLAAPDFCRVRVTGTKVVVGAGARIGRLISVLSLRSLAGYEFLAGIPGTVGGVLAMNAGARRDLEDASSYREIKDIVDWVEVLDDRGRARRFLRSEIAFGYRRSSLKGCVILRAQLRLERAARSAAEARLKNILVQRLARQDWRYPSAGSFFKNPSPAQPAGKLIDRCGLKGLRVGGAQVSDRHANFIVNVGRATSADVLKLMEIVRKRVYNRFQINLQPEVEFVS